MSEAEKIAAPQKNPETMTRDQMPKTDLETATEKLKAGIDKQIKDNPAGSAAPGERQTLAMRRPKKNLGDTLKDQQAERAAKANEAVQERLKGGVGARGCKQEPGTKGWSIQENICPGNSIKRRRRRRGLDPQ